MCGIAGIVGKIPDSYSLHNMLQSMAHRGPDNRGEWQNSSNQVWFGHQLLSIIDPEGGKQPLSNADASIWITFNGCIYNYLELARYLRTKGYKFKTKCDTEVIVYAYQEWGESCVDHFIGMFAFAIWDENKRQLFCARDRLGIKPFYYTQAYDSFAFASEIKALLKVPGVKAQVNPTELTNYLTFQARSGEETLFDGIYQLQPGYTLTLQPGGTPKIRRYWDLEFTINFDIDEATIIDQLRLRLEDAVKLRLRSDVPLGAHLSGGLDSTTVVYLAAQLLNLPGEQLQTFTGGFNAGAGFDETAYAKLVADRVQAQYHEVLPTAADFITEFPRIIYLMDEPTAGPGVFPQYMVSKLAAQHVKVVLGGQGGDEIFIGYARYLVGYLEECLKGAIDETSDSANYAATLATLIPNLPLLQQYKPMLQHFWQQGLFGEQSDRYLRLLDRSDGLTDLYAPDVFASRQKVCDRFRAIFDSAPAQSFVNRMLYCDLKIHLPALLHVEDRTSMGCSLESRVPLLDHRLVELMAQVPPAIKFKGGQPKYLFKKVIQNLIPSKILNRKDKMGFPVPLNQWYQKELKEFVSDLLLSDTAKARGIYNIPKLEIALSNERSFGRAIWGAMCMEMWFRTFIDG